MRSPPRSVLVIVTRRIGDVLLATPLIRSIKQAYPDAALDVLVFEGTHGLLSANSDVRRIITVPERPGLSANIALISRLWRRYDMAVSLVPGDRPTLYAFIAGRWRAGLLTDTRKERWKRRLLHRWVPFDNLNTHSVRMHLALADALGIAPHADVVVTWCAEAARQVNALLGAQGMQPIAVLHTYPKFNYKMWHKRGWIDIAHWLTSRGFRIVLSGSADAVELTYVADLASKMPPGAINAAGKLSLAASAFLVSRAGIYVGPDTALTHVAAALGVPTVALFGPSNPVKWGPWPKGQPGGVNPWRRCGSQRIRNVTLLQGTESCVPCLQEGCERNIKSFSDCLQHIPAEKVIIAIQAAMKIAD